MYERILVPLDGSKAAEIALPYAEEIAARLGSEIVLASVSELPGEADHLYHSYLERVAEQVQRELADWGGTGKATVKNKVLLGRPASELLRYADEKNISLVAMASRGHSGRGPWLLGNIATKVLRAAGKPVLLIRTPADGAVVQKRSLVKRILVPLDGSKLGEVAIPYAEALAKGLGAEVVLFQVFMPPAIRITYEGRSPVLSNEEEERMRASAMEYLSGVGKSFHEKGLRIATVALPGSAPDKILGYAEANEVDLIAMSTHGRSGIGRWVMGSVTDKVLHAGDIAVLVVRATRNHDVAH